MSKSKISSCITPVCACLALFAHFALKKAVFFGFFRHYRVKLVRKLDCIQKTISKIKYIHTLIYVL